jgi:predicted ATPase
MISHLAIQNFKRFSATELQFYPLTVLTGLNGTGKSLFLNWGLRGSGVRVWGTPGRSDGV